MSRTTKKNKGIIVLVVCMVLLVSGAVSAYVFRDNISYFIVYGTDGYDKYGYDYEGYNHDGYNKEGYNREGYDKLGFNSLGYNKEGYDKEGYDKEGFNKDGWDRQGYNHDGFNAKGFNRDGYLKRELDANGKPLLEQWGLKGKLTESVSNDRDYEWYIDQGNTGAYSDVNCVPASCIMALRWADKDFPMTVEEARNDYIKRYNQKAGWYNNQTIRFLRENGLRCSIKEYGTEGKSFDEEDIKNALKEGKIIVLNFEVDKLTKSSSMEDREGRIQGFVGESRHEIVIKGYRIVDGVTYLEAYDPGSMGKKRNDGTYAGKNVYYKAQDVIKGVEAAWGCYIVVDGSKYNFDTENADQEIKVSKKLAEAIRNELEKKENEKITEGDLKKVFELYVYEGAFEENDIAAMSKMVNLDSISLMFCNLTDIGFIKDMKYLTSIDALGNKIQDISVVKNLPELRKVNVSQNNITDITPIASLKHITRLYVSDNPIKDLSCIKGMKDLYCDMNH